MICRSLVSVEKYTICTRKISLRFLQHASGISTDIEDTRKVCIEKVDINDQFNEKIHQNLYRKWYKIYRDCYGGIKRGAKGKVQKGKLCLAQDALKRCHLINDF